MLFKEVKLTESFFSNGPAGFKYKNAIRISKTLGGVIEKCKELTI